MNATPHIIPSALLLLISFLIGCIIGFVLRRLIAPALRRTEMPSAATVADPAPPPPARTADDLKAIKGIGARMESKLHAQGVYAFAQIAAWDDQTIGEMDAMLAARGRITREHWVEQARALAGA